jgi:hypothetical protein
LIRGEGFIAPNVPIGTRVSAGLLFLMQLAELGHPVAALTYRQHAEGGEFASAFWRRLLDFPPFRRLPETRLVNTSTVFSL